MLEPTTPSPCERLTHSIPQAAIRLGISRSTIYALINAGELRAVKILSRTAITEKEIHRFLSKLEARAVANAGEAVA